MTHDNINWDTIKPGRPLNALIARGMGWKLRYRIWWSDTDEQLYSMDRHSRMPEWWHPGDHPTQWVEVVEWMRQQRYRVEMAWTRRVTVTVYKTAGPTIGAVDNLGSAALAVCRAAGKVMYGNN